MRKTFFAKSLPQASPNLSFPCWGLKTHRTKSNWSTSPHGFWLTLQPVGSEQTPHRSELSQLTNNLSNSDKGAICSHYTRYKCCTEALSKRHATIFHRPCTDKHLATNLTYATQTSWVLRMLSDKSINSKTNVTFSWLGYNNHSHFRRRSKRGLTSWKTTTQNKTVRSIFKEITLWTTSTLKVATYKRSSIPFISSFANPKSFLATHSKTRFTQQQSYRQSLQERCARQSSQSRCRLPDRIGTFPVDH